MVGRKGDLILVMTGLTKLLGSFFASFPVFLDHGIKLLMDFVLWDMFCGFGWRHPEDANDDESSKQD
jgi:hypothetical protein